MFNEYQRTSTTNNQRQQQNIYTNAIRETDSLAEDSIQNQVPSGRDINRNTTNNNNGYDFLLDEDYQQLKNQQEAIHFAKWEIMGEKASLHLILKELFTMVTDQTQLLIYPSNSNQASALRSFKQNYKFSSMKELYQQIKLTVNQNTGYIESLQKNLAETRNLYSKEQEKSQYHLNLYEKTKHTNVNSNNDKQRELYIQELEVQLQETRSLLLDKKLKLTDKEEELNSLRAQLSSMTQDFQALEDQKREIDELVIKVSQELKSKEYDMRDFNFQIASERDTLSRQVELLKKELQEEKERKHALERLEGDIIHKAEVKEQEIGELRSYVREIEDKLRVKGEAIEKAQKVIERLNEEMEKMQTLMSKIEQERDQLRVEGKELQKRVVELNKQNQQIQTFHQTNQQSISSQLKSEIDQLKEALRQYQAQFDEEKMHMTSSIREANDDKYRISIEKEKSEAQLKKQINHLQQTIEDNARHHSLTVKKLEQDFAEQKESLADLLRNREEQAQSQIKYLQKRLKDIANDQHSQNKGQSGQKTAYLQVLRGEFNQIANELLQMRKLLNNSFTESQYNGQLFKFQEFKARVLDELEHWNLKAEGLGQLSERYEKELNEQKKLFMGMRQVLKEKDAFIDKMQKQMRVREAHQEQHVQNIKKEMEKQTYLFKIDIMDQLKINQQTTASIQNENKDLDRRFISFKSEYMKILEERDSFQSLSNNLKQDLATLTQDYQLLRDTHYSLIDSLKQALSTTLTNPSDLLVLLRTQLDDFQQTKTQLASTQSQLTSLTSQQDSDKVFLQTKIHQVEEQLVLIQKQHLSQEEETQMLYLQKEAKYQGEISKLQSDLASLDQSNQMRERQLKKLYEQLDHNHTQIEQLEKLKLQEESHRREIEDMYQKTIQELEQIRVNLEENQKQIEIKVSKMSEMEREVTRLEDMRRYLKDQIRDREQEMQREREINLQLQEEKYMAINQYDAAQEKIGILERESANLYKDLVSQKETVKDISRAFEESEREKHELRVNCQEMNEIITQVQDEIMESQRAIETLSGQLEHMKRKYHKAKQLKSQLRLMRSTEQHLSEQIEQQRRQLNPIRCSVDVQTNDSGIQEILYYHEEMLSFQRQFQFVQRENEQLQDSLRRQNLEINRLIEEKRDMEDLVDQQNQSIKQIRMSGAVGVGGILPFNKENINQLNSMRSVAGGTDELYSKILQEKENYIMRLEAEISDMRREMEQLKEKLIQFEIGNISYERGGNSLVKSQQQSIYAKPQYKNATGGGVFRGNQTQNSMNFSNYYNATSTTNYNTIQPLPDETQPIQTASLRKSIQMH